MIKGKGVGLVSLAAFMPAKKIAKDKVFQIKNYLTEYTRLNKSYIDMISDDGVLPGIVESNYDGWQSKPWFDAWVGSMSDKKKQDPFQGTKERRRVPLDPNSVINSTNPHPMLPSDAETLAGGMALESAGIKPEEIDLLITTSQVPDRPLPPNSSLVQYKLKLDNAGAYAMDTCCSSFVSALETAISFVLSGIKDRVLIVSSYIDSHVTDRSDYFSVNTGDGAIAAVVSAVEDGYGYISSSSRSDGMLHDAIIFQKRRPGLANNSSLGPSLVQEFTTFYNQDSCKAIAKNATRDLSLVVHGALEKADSNIEDIDFLVTHQPVQWAPDAWRQDLGVSLEKFHHTFEKYGNVANCCAPVNLLDAIENGKVKGGDRVMISSSGAGENHIAVYLKVEDQLIKRCLLNIK
jgi:3-oxoacyl-[acyl-carrier-protein] synthase-3